MNFQTNSGDTDTYADRVSRQVAGLESLHKMAGILLSERVPEAGNVLVLGAGGGLELRAFIAQSANWGFVGVDPSTEMLMQAQNTLGSDANRVTFIEGYIEAAPKGPYDGATCLLTLHFLSRKERLRAVREVFRRLRPGAPFIVAQHSFPQNDGKPDLWLQRYGAYLGRSGFDAQKVNANIKTMKSRLPVLSPDDDVKVLEEAGFRDIQLFYTAFTFRGWVAYKPA
ncbi:MULTISPECIES: class I SAM-dependent methyltransferase [unclassified Pseudovibrio]|uniref:class I SAM-dependent methyltransferase n=1 Tax=unclassified Pseudovibrio TaxID=2627060 RepID=UPI0007AE46D2|nr:MULTISPECIES: class I SAM-dependent methyltransferase [unclassified Pseudovibrio]KZK97340.1 tRNA (cmo5U34)-methyltransferase [Pseudovibrio sp. W74]KZL07177.1 tRNA (cmo5U34)-methyltransferase [Pseudovibrio sp. Ad14]